jgi:hypothetical protein
VDRFKRQVTGHRVQITEKLSRSIKQDMKLDLLRTASGGVLRVRSSRMKHLKMAVVGVCEMLVQIYRTSRCHIR